MDIIILHPTSNIITPLSVLDTRIYHIGTDSSYQPVYPFVGSNYSESFQINKVPNNATLVIDTYNGINPNSVYINNVFIGNLTGYSNNWFKNIVNIPSNILQVGTNTIVITSGNDFLISNAQLLFNGDFSAVYKGIIPATETTTPVYYHIEAKDYSGHDISSTGYNFIFSSTPKIHNITINPLYPGGFDNVTVSANITSGNIMSNALLYYSLDGANYSSISMQNISSTYSATIPSTGRTTNVYYYIYAIDNLNFNTTSNTNTYIAIILHQ